MRQQLRKGLLATTIAALLGVPTALVANDDAAVTDGELEAPEGKQDLPVVVPTGFGDPIDQSIRNPISWKQLHNVVGSYPGEGMILDLKDKKLTGKICTGPYPFEYGDPGYPGAADYDYARYRSCFTLGEDPKGQGLIGPGMGVVETDRFFSDKYDANEWLSGGQCKKAADCPTTTIGYRVVLDDYGFYDGRMSFTGTGEDEAAVAQLTLIEGPFINHLNSDDPEKALISVETNKKADCVATVGGKDFASGAAAKRHEIEVSGLKPGGVKYKYQVSCTAKAEEVRSGVYSFHSAPMKGEGSVKFAFFSDSREGPTGKEAFMGHNHEVFSRVVEMAYDKGAQLAIFGGDLINGYTTSKEDFSVQLKGWKKSMEGFWRSHPVYPAMGNHETLLNVWDDGSYWGLSLDKWPYATRSAEAVFAQEFWNPTNGPEPSDKRRPQYKENVYRFQYGPVLFIAFNNNYWWTTNSQVPNYGGSPEGYMMDDQLAWIKQQLKQAEKDDSVKFIFLYAQEPVFPAGGHVNDAMWWLGDNKVRAYTKKRNGKLKAEALGIIEARNEFWKHISKTSSKVAAVLSGDEHGYHRIRIDHKTPVGVYPGDDLDGDGKLDQYSANPAFKYPTWHITAGNAGAPWYAREETPWDVEVFSSQAGFTMFEAKGGRVSMTSYSLTGQEIDHVRNLMAIK